MSFSSHDKKSSCNDDISYERIINSKSGMSTLMILLVSCILFVVVIVIVYYLTKHCDASSSNSINVALLNRNNDNNTTIYEYSAADPSSVIKASYVEDEKYRPSSPRGFRRSRFGGVGSSSGDIRRRPIDNRHRERVRSLIGSNSSAGSSSIRSSASGGERFLRPRRYGGGGNISTLGGRRFGRNYRRRFPLYKTPPRETAAAAAVVSPEISTKEKQAESFIYNVMNRDRIKAERISKHNNEIKRYVEELCNFFSTDSTILEDYLSNDNPNIIILDRTNDDTNWIKLAIEYFSTLEDSTMSTVPIKMSSEISQHATDKEVDDQTETMIRNLLELKVHDTKQQNQIKEYIVSVMSNELYDKKNKLEEIKKAYFTIKNLIEKNKLSNLSYKLTNIKDKTLNAILASQNSFDPTNRFTLKQEKCIEIELDSLFSCNSPNYEFMFTLSKLLQKVINSNNETFEMFGVFNISENLVEIENTISTKYIKHFQEILDRVCNRHIRIQEVVKNPDISITKHIVYKIRYFFNFEFAILNVIKHDMSNDIIKRIYDENNEKSKAVVSIKFDDFFRQTIKTLIQYYEKINKLKNYKHEYNEAIKNDFIRFSGLNDTASYKILKLYEYLMFILSPAIFYIISGSYLKTTLLTAIVTKVYSAAKNRIMTYLNEDLVQLIDNVIKPSMEQKKDDLLKNIIDINIVYMISEHLKDTDHFKKNMYNDIYKQIKQNLNMSKNNMEYIIGNRNMVDKLNEYIISTINSTTQSTDVDSLNSILTTVDIDDIIRKRNLDIFKQYILITRQTMSSFNYVITKSTEDIYRGFYKKIKEIKIDIFLSQFYEEIKKQANMRLQGVFDVPDRVIERYKIQKEYNNIIIGNGITFWSGSLQKIKFFKETIKRVVKHMYSDFNLLSIRNPDNIEIYKLLCFDDFKNFDLKYTTEKDNAYHNLLSLSYMLLSKTNDLNSGILDANKMQNPFRFIYDNLLTSKENYLNDLRKDAILSKEDFIYTTSVIYNVVYEFNSKNTINQNYMLNYFIFDRTTTNEVDKSKRVSTYVLFFFDKMDASLYKWYVDNLKNQFDDFYTNVAVNSDYLNDVSVLQSYGTEQCFEEYKDTIYKEQNILTPPSKASYGYCAIM